MYIHNPSVHNTYILCTFSLFEVCWLLLAVVLGGGGMGNSYVDGQML